jgi:hypothetical protein
MKTRPSLAKMKLRSKGTGDDSDGSMSGVGLRIDFIREANLQATDYDVFS